LCQQEQVPFENGSSMVMLWIFILLEKKLDV